MRATSDEDKADNWCHTTWITTDAASRNGKIEPRTAPMSPKVCRTSEQASGVIQAVKAALGYTQLVDDYDRWQIVNDGLS